MDQIGDQMADQAADHTASLPLSCPDCAAQMPATAAFCPACGIPMRPEKPAPGKVGPFAENVAGGLAYLTFLPAIIFLARPPYKNNHFVRFHSAQCLLLWIAGIVITVGLKLAGLALFFIPMAGPLFVVLIYVVGGLALLTMWIVLVVKALQGEMYGLPILGAFAELYAAGQGEIER
jgi:uncharacterized membrane protein